jgi:hypothetical protein
MPSPRKKKIETDRTPLDLASFEIECETKDGGMTKVRYPLFRPSAHHRFIYVAHLYFFLHATTDDEAHMGDKGFPINSALSIRFEFEVRAALVRKIVSLSAIIECKLMHTHRFIFIA